MSSSATTIARTAARPEERAWLAWLSVAAVAALFLVGLGLRLKDLPLATLSMGIDEARLTLVARGIQEHGWPLLPSGKVYTRGLPAAVSIVPSLDLFGPTDFAARLPSVMFGALLVPVVALYAGRLGGRSAAVIAALLVALYPPLVFWSRQAWLFSPFVLFWMLTLVGLDAALQRWSERGLILAAIATALGLLTHELFLALLPCWVLCLYWLYRTYGGFSASQRAVVPLLVLAAGLVLLGSFTLTHRADTLAGRMAEINEYLTLNTDLAGFRFYGRMLADRYWLLLLAAIAALTLKLAARRFLLLVAILPLFVVDAFILPDRPQERYGLALVPPMMVLAAVGLSDLASIIRQRVQGSWGLFAGTALLVVVPLIHLDINGAMRRIDVARISGTWLGDLRQLGYQDEDIVMTDMPTVTQLYLGHTEYWLVSHEYEKYAYEPDGQLREIHTNARLVRSPGELEHALMDEQPGRRVWVIGSDRSYQWQELVDRNLRRAVDEQAVTKMQSEDSVRLFRLEP